LFFPVTKGVSREPVAFEITTRRDAKDSTLPSLASNVTAAAREKTQLFF
jgi:hypothetical protein